MYSVSIRMTATHAKDMSFTIPDFLKEYAEDGDSDDYIFEYTNKSRYDTDMAKEYQITPEAYGVYFVYETPEGVKKHYMLFSLRRPHLGFQFSFFGFFSSTYSSSSIFTYQI